MRSWPQQEEVGKYVIWREVDKQLPVIPSAQQLGAVDNEAQPEDLGLIRNWLAEKGMYGSIAGRVL